MIKTLSYLSILLGLLGTLLLALDVLKPVYLKAIRQFLSEFAVAVKKTRIFPRDKRVRAHRETVIQFLSGNKPEDKDFKKAYLEKISAMNYEPDLNLNFRYRTFVYAVTGLLILVGFIYFCYMRGFSTLLSLDGLKILGAFAIANISLMGAWSIDWMTEMAGAEDPEVKQLPPMYKITFGRSHPDFPMFIFTVIQIITNVVAKIMGKILSLTIMVEKYTISDQAPRVLGILFLLFAFVLQFIITITAK